MRFRPTNSPGSAPDRRAGFTLAEALAALAFLALVLPVAIRGVQVANRAGQVALRQDAAARVADQILSEIVATGLWQQASSGTVDNGRTRFDWQVQRGAWTAGPVGSVSLTQLTLRVAYSVQDQPYEVVLNTLVDPAMP